MPPGLADNVPGCAGLPLHIIPNNDSAVVRGEPDLRMREGRYPRASRLPVDPFRLDPRACMQNRKGSFFKIIRLSAALLAGLSLFAATYSSAAAETRSGSALAGQA